MAIYKGRNKIGDLYLGDKKVLTVHKGADLIYSNKNYDYKFTIDTTYTSNGTNNDTSTKVQFSNRGAWNYGLSVGYTETHFKIDWGDGTSNTYDQSTSANSYVTLTHTYDTAGEYQITISPLDPSVRGWLTGFKYNGSSDTFYKVKSIDTVYPEGSLLFSPKQVEYALPTASYLFRDYRNLESCPAGWLDNAVFETSEQENFREFFANTFRECAYNTGLDLWDRAKGFIAKIDTTNGTNFQEMFYSTFYNAFYSSTTATLPSGLFDSITTTNGTNFQSMFFSTFAYAFYSSTTATLPSGLFDSITTTNGTNFQEMFSSTFNSAFRSSTTATLPSGLFDSITTTNGTNFQEMFYSTFNSAFRSSTTATLPSGLFDSITTTNGTNFQSMFTNTFNYAFYKSEAVSLPSGFFKNIDTTNLDTSSTQYGRGIFYGTFNNFNGSGGYTELTDVFSGMPSMNWATADYVNLSMSSLYSVIGSMFRSANITGSASTILQYFDFTPTVDTAMFYSCSRLDDYSTINDNWK